MRTAAPFLLTALAMGVLIGCARETGTFAEPIAARYDRPLEPGQSAFRKLAYTRDVPDFTDACENIAALRLAIDNSLNFLSKPSSRRFYPCNGITHDRVVASLRAFADVLDSGAPAKSMNDAIRDKFDVYTSVGWDDRGTVLFTGYYTPVFDASPARSARFCYPIYKQPTGLLKRPDGTILGLPGRNGQYEKYPSRKEIETSGMLAGSELYWLSDPFEAYVAHVQGSAKLRLPDGRTITVGYAANNGHEYVSVGKELVADGKIAGGSLSLQAMIDYFKAHPGQVTEYTWRNPRFVFFTEKDQGPTGSINEPVIPWRTIATDKQIFPPGSLAYISTVLPRPLADGVAELPFGGFVLDQDAGGAIRAPGRCDVYMGVGEKAGLLAGRTYTQGRLYYLFLKPSRATPSAPLQPMTRPTE